MFFSVVVIWPLYWRLISSYVTQPTTDLIATGKVISGHIAAFYTFIGIWKEEGLDKEGIEPDPASIWRALERFFSRKARKSARKNVDADSK